MANEIPIEPAFTNINASLVTAVEKYLAQLDASQLIEMGLLSVEPAIPKTQVEIDEHIAGWVFLYEPEDAADAIELKKELLDIAQGFSLLIDGNLPLEQFQAVMQSQLRALAPEELLARGVFGGELTDQDIEETRKIIITCYTGEIKAAAVDQLLIEIGKAPTEGFEQRMAFYGKHFPGEIDLVKEHLRRRDLLN